MNKNIKFILRILRLIFYITFFTAFIIIPTETFYKDSICMIYNITGLECPTCGVTRAFSSIMHFQFKNAFNFNPIFTLMICPICVSIFFQDIFIIVSNFIKKKDSYSLIEYLFKL